MITDIFEKQYIDDIENINRLSFTDGWSRKLVEDDVSNPNSYYVVAVENGRAYAYGSITVIAGEANLTNIAVHPEKRGCKTGEAILGKLIDFCIENNLLLITLEVRKSNQAAISLYKKMGFAQEGERKKYYSDNGEDALIMTRRF